MAGLTIADADLAATFSCRFKNLSLADATLEISTVSYSSPIVAMRASTTHFLSNYQETSRTVSVFTRNAETHEGGRFATPSFPQPISTRCTRFELGTTGNGLVRLLANTAAEVAYFNRVGLTQPLIVKGKYIRASSRLATRDRGALVKVVIADSRLGFLASKPGEFNHRTGGNVRFTRMDKYERSDIAAGTLIVFVTMNAPFPLGRRTRFLNGLFQIPEVIARNLAAVILTTDNEYPRHVRELVQYIDLCINPIVEGLPDQGEYLHTVWFDTPRVLMDHIVAACDVFDPRLLSNILGFLGAKLNLYLDEGLPVIAGRFEFARLT